MPAGRLQIEAHQSATLCRTMKPMPSPSQKLMRCARGSVGTRRTRFHPHAHRGEMRRQDEIARPRIRRLMSASNVTTMGSRPAETDRQRGLDGVAPGAQRREQESPPPGAGPNQKVESSTHLR